MGKLSKKQVLMVNDEDYPFEESQPYKYKKGFYYEDEKTVGIDFWKENAIFGWEGAD